MKPVQKYSLLVLSLFAAFKIFLYLTGFFRIGLLSDDYLNFFDATHSTILDKLTGTLSFTNPSHLRPVYYISLQVSSFLHNALGFSYDNFVLYRVQNLVLYFIISYMAGLIVLYKTGKVSFAAFTGLIIVLFPNNIHNICWTAGRVDLLCCMFYLGAFYFSLLYIEKKSALKHGFVILFFIIALFTKETAVTFPFVLTAFFLFDSKGFKVYKPILISLLAILTAYLLFRFAILGTGFQRYYNIDPLTVLLKSIVSLAIPLDYLSFKLYILNINLIIIMYLVIIVTGIITYALRQIKKDVYKPILYLILIMFILIAPYLYAGYIRPQMILIPFVLITIFVLVSYDWLKRSHTNVPSKFPSLIIILMLMFFAYYSYNAVKDWLFAYNNAHIRIESLLKINFEPSKHTIIIGNAGRLKQSYLFDKLTGAYGYWKNKEFSIKDTINDIVQTGALDEGSLNSRLNYKITGVGEYEISATGETQFFYMEGFDDEKSKWIFANKDMAVEAIGYNFLNKPIRIKLTVLSPDADCYLASEMNYIKIY